MGIADDRGEGVDLAIVTVEGDAGIREWQIAEAVSAGESVLRAEIGLTVFDALYGCSRQDPAAVHRTAPDIEAHQFGKLARTDGQRTSRFEHNILIRRDGRPSGP